MEKVIGSASDVSSYQVGIQSFQLHGIFRVARKHQIAKPGSEALDLGFDCFGHILGRPVRNVAVSPARVAPCRGARGIKEAWLRQQHERHPGNCSIPRGSLRSFDFVRAATEVQSRAARALGVSPRE